MPEEVQPDDSGAAEGTSPEGPSSRSETLEAELAALEAMLPPDDPASPDSATGEGRPDGWQDS